MSEMSKSGLLKSIRSGYEVFKELLAEFNREQLTRPGVIGEWSVKDIVAHIVVHEQRMIQWAGERLRGEMPRAPQPYDMPEDELAVVNERIYRENRDRSLQDVLHDLDQAHAEAMALVDAAAEEDLMDPHRFQLKGGEPLREAIAANTFQHYEEHSRDIRAWQVAARGTVT